MQAGRPSPMAASSEHISGGQHENQATAQRNPAQHVPGALQVHQADGGGPSVQQLQKVLDNIQAKDKANIFKEPVTEKIVSSTTPTALTPLKQQPPSAACAEEEVNALAARDRP